MSCQLWFHKAKTRKNCLATQLFKGKYLKIYFKNSHSIKQALEEEDKLKEQRSKIFEEGVQKCANFNAIEDLIAVFQGTAQKGEVFEKHKSEFKTIYVQLEVLDKKKAELNGVIT